jgi:hypothetical protein
LFKRAIAASGALHKAYALANQDTIARQRKAVSAVLMLIAGRRSPWEQDGDDQDRCRAACSDPAAGTVAVSGGARDVDSIEKFLQLSNSVCRCRWIDPVG